MKEKEYEVYFYYNGQTNFLINLPKSEMKYLYDTKEVYIYNNKFYLDKNKSFKYLFIKKDQNIKVIKRRFESLKEQNFICSDCGKIHSYNIRPEINIINGEKIIDFYKIICCCKHCRYKKLQKNDILVPLFKTEINWKEEMNKIYNEIRKKHIKNKQDYISISKKIILYEKYLKIILPIRNNLTFESNEFIMLNNELGEDIDLSLYENRFKIRRFLYDEMHGKCHICGNNISFKHYTIDHIIPKYNNGKNELKNFIGLCENCNKEKDHKSLLNLLLNKEVHNLPNRVLNQAYIEQDYVKKQLYYLRIILKNII